MGVYLHVHGGHDVYGCNNTMTGDPKTDWPSERLRTRLQLYADAYDHGGEDCWFVLSLPNLLTALGAHLKHQKAEGYEIVSQEDLNQEDDQMIKHILNSIAGDSGYDVYDFYRLEWS